MTVGARARFIEPEELWPDEWVEWFRMTPQERWAETEKLWAIYLSLGGSLDLEPDTQSPFYDPDSPGPGDSHGRAGMRIMRRSGIGARRRFAELYTAEMMRELAHS